MGLSNLLKRILYFGPRLTFVAFLMYLFAVMALGNFDMFEPYLYPLHAAQRTITAYGDRITIGHYPSIQELKRLKRERHVEIDISLLDEEMPQERALNQRLAKNAAPLGIQVIRLPLNYLDLNGKKNAKTIADVADFVEKNRSKNIYIHCYLGRHRVGVVREELIRRGVIRQNTGKP